jgi:hypothetical protein
MKKIHSSGVLSIHQNSGGSSGKPGDRVGGEMQLGFQNVTDSSAVFILSDFS